MTVGRRGRLDDPDASQSSTRATRCARWPRPVPRCGAPSSRPTRPTSPGGRRRTPTSVLVARSAAPRSSVTCSSSSPSPARPCRSPPAATRRCPAGSARSTWSSPSRQSGRAAGPLAVAAEAARRGASLFTVGAAGSPLAESAPGPVGSTSRWPWRPLPPAPRCGRCSRRCSWRPTRSAWCRPCRCSTAADVLDAVAEECRPSSEAFVNPAKILATGWATPSPSCSGTARSTVSPRPALPRCWRGPPACPRPTASSPMPRRRSWRASTARSAPASRPPSGSGAGGGTSSPTPSSTARPRPGSAC